MNFIETTVIGIRLMTLQNIENTFFTTQSPSDTYGKYWRIQPDCTLPDDGVSVLVNTVGQRFIYFVPDYVNGKWFGAIGDGNTDDTIAVQRAVDFAMKYRVGSLLFPAGIYIITQTIYINLFGANPLNPIIKGVGKNATIFQSGLFEECIPFYEAAYSEEPPVPTPIVIYDFPTPPAVFNVNGNNHIDTMVSFESLTVQGNSGDVMTKGAGYYEVQEIFGSRWYYLNDNSWGPTGVMLELTALFHVTDVSIYDYNVCVWLRGALSFNMDKFLIGGSNFLTLASTGIYSERGTTPNGDFIYCNAITLTNGRICYCSQKGINFGQGNLLTLRSLDMEWNGSTMLNEKGEIIGNPDTGAVFILDDVNDEGTTFQLNMYDCWFEMNKGYTFRNYPISAPNQAVLLNFTGCLFHFWDINKELECLGLLSENTTVGETKVSFTSCVSTLPVISTNPPKVTFRVISEYVLLNSCSFITSSYYDINSPNLHKINTL
jgi:hypothetical protein